MKCPYDSTCKRMTSGQTRGFHKDVHHTVVKELSIADLVEC